MDATISVLLPQFIENNKFNIVDSYRVLKLNKPRRIIWAEHVERMGKLEVHEKI
jgi:hypothetical protein